MSSLGTVNDDTPSSPTSNSTKNSKVSASAGLSGSGRAVAARIAHLGIPAVRLVGAIYDFSGMQTSVTVVADRHCNMTGCFVGSTVDPTTA